MIKLMWLSIKIAARSIGLGFTKTWKASFMVICSWFSSIFGDEFMALLDGTHNVIDHLVPIVATIATAVAGIWIAIKKGRAELRKIAEEEEQKIKILKQERYQDKQNHLIELIHKLKEDGEINKDMPLPEALKYIEQLTDKIT